MEPLGFDKHRSCNRNGRAEWMARNCSGGSRLTQSAETHGEGQRSSISASGFQDLLLPSLSVVGPWAAEVQLRDGVVGRFGVALADAEFNLEANHRLGLDLNPYLSRHRRAR
jgi:hypothetical protein